MSEDMDDARVSDEVGGTAYADAVGEERRERWRMLLGRASRHSLGDLSAERARQAQALDFLYEREGSGRNIGGGQEGGLGDSQLTVPDWINEVHELFPRRIVERLEDDALSRYGLVEMVTRKDVIERVEPSETLLRAVLATKHLMSDDVLQAARTLVRRVVQQLIDAMATQIETPFTGVRNPLRRSRIPLAANFDAKATVRANLKHVDPDTGRLVIREPLFASRTRRHVDRWQVIMLVDQSGSMVDSVIHSAVTASVFHGIGALRSHLIAFDTNVVDLTSDVADPVETLMKVQLGGGTQIGQALTYAESLVDQPRRTMVVLVSDLYEGGDPHAMYAVVRRLVEGGAKVLVLGALTKDGAANFDQEAGRVMARLGARVGVMTPYELADWVAEVMS